MRCFTRRRDRDGAALLRDLHGGAALRLALCDVAARGHGSNGAAADQREPGNHASRHPQRELLAPRPRGHDSRVAAMQTDRRSRTMVVGTGLQIRRDGHGGACWTVALARRIVQQGRNRWDRLRPRPRSTYGFLTASLASLPVLVN